MGASYDNRKLHSDIWQSLVGENIRRNSIVAATRIWALQWFAAGGGEQILAVEGSEKRA
jgi:hypothetical protein